MAIPTPSFFKIRLYAFLIGFLVLCFLVGAVKDAFAVDGVIIDGSCWVYQWDDVSTKTSYKSESQWVAPSSGHELPFESAGTASDALHHRFAIYSYKWTGSYWNAGSYNTTIMLLPAANSVMVSYFEGLGISENTHPNSYWPDGPPEGCSDPVCEDEKTAKEEECGGDEYVDWSNWSNATCSGAVCIPPDACPKSERLKAEYACPGIDFIWDEETCTGKCEPTGECTQEEWDRAISACGARGVATIDSTVEGCPYKCNPDCQDSYSNAVRACGVYGIGEFNWVSCEYVCDKCPEKKSACETSCADKGGVGHHDCTMSFSGTPVDTCVCGTDMPQGEPSLGKDLDSENITYNPPSDKVEPDPDDDTPTSPYVKADLDNIDKNLKANVGNQQTIGKLLENIAENQRRTASNTSSGLNGTGSITGAIDGLGNKLGGKLDALGDDLGSEDGDGTGDGEGGEGSGYGYDPYASDEHDFSNRTSEFLANMKTTGIFSLPDTMSSSIPGGGSSTYTISTGDTFGGDHTIDFNYLSAALITLKYIFQIAGMALAIRIVTLKS